MKESAAKPVSTHRSADPLRKHGSAQSPAGPAGGWAAALLEMQKNAGNSAVERFLASDPGQPLETGGLLKLSAAYGLDLSGVRIHTGTEAEKTARAAGASAFTFGDDIVFSAGRYAPGTPSGDRLIAHELAHVVQQRAAGGAVRAGFSQAGDAYETAAGNASGLAVSGQPAGAAARGASGGAPAAVQREESPADEAARKRAQGNLVLDELNASIISAFNSNHEGSNPGLLLAQAYQLQQDFENSPGKRTYFASARALLDIHRVLAQQEASSPKDKDGVLQYKQWTELVPWSGKAKSLNEIPPFNNKENLKRWQEAMDISKVDSDLAQATKGRSGTVNSSQPGGPGQSAQNQPPPPPTMVTSFVGEAGEVPSEEKDPKALKYDIRRGLAALEGATVGQAVDGLKESLADVRKKNKDPQGIESFQGENKDIPLLKAAGKVIYVGQQAYLIDRTGHITAEQFSYPLSRTTLQPGGVYFMGNFMFGMKGSKSVWFQNVLLRVDGGKVRIAGGDVFLQGVNNSFVPVFTEVSAALKAGNGFAIIVSGNYDKRKEEYDKGYDFEKVKRAIAGADYYIPWATRTHIRSILANWEEALFKEAVGLGIGWLAKRIPVIAAAQKMLDAIETEIWLLDLLKVAGLAVSEDEINLVSQSIAMKVAVMMVEKVKGKIVHAATSAAGSLAAKGSAGKGGGAGTGEGGSATPAVKKPAAPGGGEGGEGSAPAPKPKIAAGGNEGGTGAPAVKPKAGAAGSGEGIAAPPPAAAPKAAAGGSDSGGAAAAPPVRPAPGGTGRPAGAGAPPPAPAAAGGNEGSQGLTVKPAAPAGGTKGGSTPPPQVNPAADSGAGSTPADQGSAPKTPPKGNLRLVPKPADQAPGGGEEGGGPAAAAKPAPDSGKKDNVIPIRPKPKGDAPDNEPNQSAAPKEYKLDPTTGQPVEVRPGSGGFTDPNAPSGIATQPGAKASGNGGDQTGGPPPGKPELKSVPTGPAAGGSGPAGKGGAKPTPGTGDKKPNLRLVPPAQEGGEEGAAKPPAQGGANKPKGAPGTPAEGETDANPPDELAARRARKQAQSGKPANEDEEAPDSLPPASQRQKLTPAQKARADALRGPEPEERRNPPPANATPAQLPDVRHRFRPINEVGPNGERIEGTAGELGEPGKVRSIRDRSGQSGVSGGTGDDAGHRIASRYGAPGGPENLARQNRVQNRGQGTWFRQEVDWDPKLAAGIRIFAEVRDYFRPGETRPYKRTVEWSELDPKTNRITHSESKVVFVNSGSVTQREHEQP